MASGLQAPLPRALAWASTLASRPANLVPSNPCIPAAFVNPPTTRHSPARALAAADPKLGRLIQRAGPFSLRVSSAQSPFEALVESIVYSSFTARPLPPSTAACSSPSRPCLRSPPPAPAPIPRRSRSSTAPPRSFAPPASPPTRRSPARPRRQDNRRHRAHAGPHPPHVGRCHHRAPHPGPRIGRWTVEMLLIFRLGRPNVFPSATTVCARASPSHSANSSPPTRSPPPISPFPAEMLKRGARWAPWRSVATWYLWRACDLASGALTPQPGD